MCESGCTALVELVFDLLCHLMSVKYFITIFVLLSMSACRGDDFHRHRILDWGRHYYDRTKDYNNTESVLDLDGLTELLGSDFTTPTPTPFYMNDSESIQCAIVPFGYLILCGFAAGVYRLVQQRFIRLGVLYPCRGRIFG